MDAETVAHKTGTILETRGFCFWKCKALNGDTIAIVKDHFQSRALDCAKQMVNSGKLKELPAIYTMDELYATCESPDILLIHEAKKSGGVIEAAQE